MAQTAVKMDRQMTHLVRLMDDLLDVNRITLGKLELRRQKVLLTRYLRGRWSLPVASSMRTDTS
jgi:hypothetical protein